MPHVDEGTLHAYLDGALDVLVEAGALPRGTTRANIDAHLASCADCRALLEAERDIRGRAGAILDDAGAQSVDVPPFATVQQQSAARPRRRAWPLAWAASLLLAGGAGWWGSELFRAERYVEVSESAAPGSAFDIVAPPSIAAPQSESMSPREPATGRAAGTTATLQDAADALDRQRDERRTTNPAAPGAVAADVAADAVRRLEAGAALRKAEDRVATSGDSAAVRAAEQITVTRTPIDPTTSLTRQLAGAPAVPPPAAPGVLGLVSGNVDAATEARIDAARQLLAYLDGNLVPFTPATAAEFDDMPLLQLRDAGTPRIERGVLIGYSVARVTQRTANGTDIELVQLRQASLELQQLVVTGVTQQRETQQRAASPAQQAQVTDVAAAARPTTSTAPVQVADRTLADGRREVVLHLPASNLFIAVRTSLPPDELQRLLARLAPIERD